MAKYQKYAEYKDSGVEWLGEIPSCWKAIRLKHLILDNLVYGANEAAEDDNPNNPRYIRITDMNSDGSLDPNTFRSLPYHIAQSYLLQDGDILLARSGATVGKSFLFKSEFGTSCFAGYLIRARSNKSKLNPKFAYWFFQSESYWKYVSGSQIQATIQNVSAEKYGDLYLSLPEIQDQGQIANFLDHETAKIDTLITKQGKLIELLKEKRQAVISHAVTKGLNPNAPMKDSGVEWLGEVPGHWTVSLIKYQCKEITDGAHISPELENGEHLFVSIRDIKEGIINFEDALLTSEKSYQYLVHTGCMPFEGDILFSKDGTIGQTAITPPNVDFVVASSLIIIRPKFSKVIPEFLDLLLRSDVVQEQVESFVKGAALRRLSIQNLLKIWGIFPPLAEQKELVDFVQLQLEKYKILEVKAEQQVELLRERRTALISAAVTGKIDVCNWQHPNQKNNNNTELSA